MITADLYELFSKNKRIEDKNMNVIGTLLMTTALAGVAGTGLGGLVGAMLQKDSNRTVSLLLSFAGGVMLSVVSFDLVL